MEFGQHLTSLVGNEINILLSDGNSIEGVLAAIKNDYFVIETDKNIIYHNIKNMKGFTKSTKNSKNSKSQKKKKLKTTFVTDYSSEGMTLREVLENHQSKWISIDTDGNQNNKQGYTGFLAEIGDDYIILVGKDAQVYLNISHINTIVKATESNTQSNNNNQNSNDNNNSGTSVMDFESIFGGSRS
ncbi:hypothetical protein RRV45_15890 [Bacillus sp. DTU_2020_1000418_1_SI_GHA_SEK_038]|uniref:hypothetical protein n=1 Tax=Bacillus sp. DTU_2020_1000418_1_SI_GHA_SEK_038 TaxID=3077585 RepID=UPI0028E9EC4B|nr:hypothetical protein [Bacillus sp. DTU_2020_1000418_1_SI_GHA_SEK_038]WNS74383.1 hypothetical protein RRV45_15890 [Bacillus sp. DTU_2020_1000418_1_SI_GHA_SEK_038]